MALSAQLTQEIASAQSDPKYYIFDGTPEIPDDTLRFLLGSNFDKYDLILKDPKAKALLEVRDRNVVCREWEVVPASSSSKDKKAADIVKEVLLGCDFDQMCSDLNSNSLLKGNAFVELKWGIDGATTYITDSVAKPNHRFKFVLHEDKANSADIYNTDDMAKAADMSKSLDDIGIYKGYEIRVLNKANFYLGDTVPAKRILCHSYGRRSDNPYGVGLGRVLYWMAVIFKKEIWKQRLIYLDQYAQPTKIGKPPSESELYRSTKEQRDEFREAIQHIVAGKVGVLPPGWTIDLLEASRSSSNDAFQNAIDAINAEMAMLVLGETLSMEITGNGSRAATESHTEGSSVYLAKFDSDRMSTGSLRVLSQWITELNISDAKAPMIWRKFPELDNTEDLNSRIGRDNGLKQLGYQMTLEKVTEVYGDGYVDLAKLQADQQANQAQQQQDSGAFDIGFNESNYAERKAIAFQKAMSSELILPSEKGLILP